MSNYTFILEAASPTGRGPSSRLNWPRWFSPQLGNVCSSTFRAMGAPTDRAVERKGWLAGADRIRQKIVQLTPPSRNTVPSSLEESHDFTPPSILLTPKLKVDRRRVVIPFDSQCQAFTEISQIFPLWRTRCSRDGLVFRCNVLEPVQSPSSRLDIAE